MDVAPNPPLPSILYVITKGTWGGAQRYVHELATEAKARGHVVQVACGTRGEMVERLTRDGVSVVLIPGLARDVRLGSDVRALLGLMSLIRRERPTIVHANSSKAGFIANLAARCMSVRQIVFTAHGWAWNERRPQWQQRAFKVLHLATVLLAHRAIAVSEAVLLDASWMPWAKQRFSLVRLGVAPLELVPRTEARLFLEHTIGPSLPSAAFWIGALAELHPTKGLDVLIRAFARFASEFPTSVLVLIGAGEDRGRLVALAHMLHVEARVFFAGHVQDAARILSALDVFAFPSYSEALGYALLEAGQSSLPVAASRVGGIPEIVTDGENGLLTPAGDDILLAESLRTLLGDSELRTRLGQALQNRVLTEFSRERMLDKTFALYS
jgi:glycosyltransferase involved in cell wall biosynthesis